MLSDSIAVWLCTFLVWLIVKSIHKEFQIVILSKWWWRVDERTTWNIFVTNEVRGGTKGSVKFSVECPSREPFFANEKNHQNKLIYFILVLQALLLVTNQAEPFKGLLTAVHLFV